MSLGLYVHVPFCSAICNYCTFNRGLFDHAQKAEYVAADVLTFARLPMTKPVGVNRVSPLGCGVSTAIELLATSRQAPREESYNA